MHALGNDYIYFDCFDTPIEAPKTLAVRLCDRRKSVGGDGIILLGKSAIADAKMRIFNADGSEAQICGNGLRCAARWLYEVKGVKKRTLAVETRVGVKRARVFCNAANEAEQVYVNMGVPAFEAERVPVSLAGDATGAVVARGVEVRGVQLKITCVSVGNPHCVTFSPSAREAFERIGKDLESAPFFPQRANVEVAQIAADNKVFVRVFERGSGETFACGSGACAVVAAGIREGRLRENREIEVVMRGGSLFVRQTKRGELLLRGEAKISFCGKVEI